MADVFSIPAGPSIEERRGRILYDLGEIEAAALAFGRALEVDPHNLGLITRLAYCLLQLERLTEAFEMFVLVLRQDASRAEAHYGFAVTLLGLGDLDGAAREFRFTLDLQPDHAAALTGLATQRQWSGDVTEARALAERALEVDPSRAGAVVLLGRLDVTAGDFAGAEARLNALLARVDLEADDRYPALGLLADAVDGQGRYEEALALYVRAQDFGRTAYADKFAVASEEALAATRQAGEGFRQAPVGRPALPPPSADERIPREHVFLVGFPRSGTTLLEQILASHPDVATMEEHRSLPPGDVFQGEAEAYQRLADLDEETRREHRKHYWLNVDNAGVDPRGKVFIDKFPLSTIKLPVIAGLFPEAKILFAVRDPRDVVLSCYRRTFGMNAAMYQFTSLDGTAQFYDAVMQIGALAHERLPLPFHDLHYERLVENLDAEVQAVCDFIGLDFHPAMRDFATRAQTHRIRTPSALQVSKGLYRDGVAQWRHYADALQGVMPILQPWIARFGYPQD